jgi:hypothetical protein
MPPKKQRPATEVEVRFRAKYALPGWTNSLTADELHQLLLSIEVGSATCGADLEYEETRILEAISKRRTPEELAYLSVRDGDLPAMVFGFPNRSA